MASVTPRQLHSAPMTAPTNASSSTSPAHAPAGPATEPARRTLYPEIEPLRTGRLRVSDVHEIYFEESGNPDGKPVVFLHGGPGGGTEPTHRRFFDPKAYRIVLFDQRGCGKSTPHASLVDNTTWHLVSDIEALRVHLGITKWQVFGGSWGSALALAYAETHPECVTELVLRGIFLLRKQEIDWFYQRGASALFADAWEAYLAAIPPAERGDLVRAYHRRLTSDDPAVRAAAARAWSLWEGSTSYLLSNPDAIGKFGGDEFAIAFARIECHYFVNDGFFAEGRDLLTHVDRIRHIPAVIVQGRYDVVCPMESAWALHRAWPEADLRVVADAGHAATEPGNVHELIEATDRFRSPRDA
jgi:proline iminopeptidase